ncbi:hypothetical protein CYMTET_23806 [Cymbomonas tetramitiformis]|uniref:Uncharacterized protein n=1 Tax=Cymbomonas tetramitiformis TaxID=36881 RepID=A0AAE0FX69_9CHLO|nr:hypothetical protein CYMTET_23806 [Cymbomonas tetramitiformis]
MGQPISANVLEVSKLRCNEMSRLKADNAFAMQTLTEAEGKLKESLSGVVHLKEARELAADELSAIRSKVGSILRREGSEAPAVRELVRKPLPLPEDFIPRLLDLQEEPVEPEKDGEEGSEEEWTDDEKEPVAATRRSRVSESKGLVDSDEEDFVVEAKTPWFSPYVEKCGLYRLRIVNKFGRYLMVCQDNKELIKYRTTDRTIVYTCNICGFIQAYNSMMRGCRHCNYDICEYCWGQKPVISKHAQALREEKVEPVRVGISSMRVSIFLQVCCMNAFSA